MFHVKQKTLFMSLKEIYMNTRYAYNTRQLTLLISNLLIAKMMFTFPRFLFKNSGNAAWIQAIYMSLLAYIIFCISLIFFKRTGNRSILQLAESIGKKPLKILVSLIVCAIIIANISAEIRIFAESVKIVLLPKTNIEYIMLFFVITVILGGYCGFSALSTINALFFPLFLFSIAALSLALIPSYLVNNIFPVFGTGANRIFFTGLKEMYCFSDLIVLNLLLPYCGDVENVKKSGKQAIIISGSVLTLICLSYALTYPYPYSTEFLLIPYQLSRMVRAGEYFQRFEALFEFIWTITQLLYSSIYLVILCKIFADTFSLKSEKPLFSCTFIGLCLLAFVPSSVVGVLDNSFIIRQILAPIAFILPILIPCIYIIISRRKGKGQKNA